MAYYLVPTSAEIVKELNYEATADRLRAPIQPMTPLLSRLSSARQPESAEAHEDDLSVVPSSSDLAEEEEEFVTAPAGDGTITEEDPTDLSHTPRPSITSPLPSISETPANGDSATEAPVKKDSVTEAPAKRASVTEAPAKRDSVTEAPAKRPSVGETQPAKRPSVSEAQKEKRPSVTEAKPAKRPSVAESQPAKRPSVAETQPAKRASVSESKPASKPTAPQAPSAKAKTDEKRQSVGMAVDVADGEEGK